MPAKQIINRRNFIRTGILGAIGSATYAHWVEPNILSINQQEIHLPHLPKALDGIIIAQLTDIHYIPEKQEELIAEAVSATNAANPDIVALTGDFITSDMKVFPPLMDLLSNIRAKHGVYGIMGNHDGWHGEPFIFRQMFQRAGFDFLINQGTSIKIRNEDLYLLGTDSIWSGKVDAAAAYRGHKKQQPVIALVHEPDVFDQLRKDYRVDLQLSGHTHGGQCRVPLIGYAPVKVRYGRNYIHGSYQKEDASIFVSQGLGTVGRRVRFACKPEVAILTLRSGKKAS